MIIINDDLELVRILLNNETKNSGYHNIVWNFTDDEDNYVVPGIYRAIIHMQDSEFHCRGDILLEQPDE